MEPSDWKQYVKIVSKVFERFVENEIKLAQAIVEKTISAEDKYQELTDFMKHSKERSAHLFNHAHSRSNASFHFMILRASGHIDDSWLAGFSEDFLKLSNLSNEFSK